MSSSYRSKVRDLLKTRQSCFSFVWDINFSIFPYLCQAKVSTDLKNFVDINVCMKTLNELCISNKIQLCFVYKNVIAVPHFFIKNVSFTEQLMHLRFFMVQQFLSRLPRISSISVHFFIKNVAFLKLCSKEKSSHK